MTRPYMAVAIALWLTAATAAAPAPSIAQSREAIIAAALADAERELADALPRLTDAVARTVAIGELAMLYHAQARLPQAVAAYRRALAAAPSPACEGCPLALPALEALRWRYLLGVALAEAGELDAAIAAYDQALQLAPADGLANYRLGAALLLQGDHKGACAALEKALVAMPDSPAVLAALGEAAAAGGALARARSYLERAAALAPAAGRIAYRLGVVHRELGNAGAAERWFARRNDVAAAVADPRLAAVAERSLSPKFLLAAGNRAKARGDWAEALAAFERAVALDPEDTAVGLAHADALEALGRTAAALAATEAVLARAPAAADAKLLQAFLLHRSDRPADALAAAERGVALRPDRAGRILLAALRIAAGRFAPAAADYEALAREFPQEPYFAYWLGMARLGAGDCADGRQAMASAVALASEWGQAHIALCRAIALCGQDSELAAARARARQLIARADNVDTRLTLAYLDLRQGQRMAARQAANAALPHPDAALLLAAIERNALPPLPFADASPWWLPPELTRRPAAKMAQRPPASRPPE